jgi:hypothetical protein
LRHRLTRDGLAVNREVGHEQVFVTRLLERLKMAGETGFASFDVRAVGVEEWYMETRDG